jgi:general secretion pathway protein B
VASPVSAVVTPPTPASPKPKELPARPKDTPPEPAAPAATTEPRVHRLADLPENIRRDLPKLTLGGAMYSDKPASRMLIINGQVFHEGDSLGGELSLKQIRLKEAVLEFRGYRYEVTY